jgi:2-amino-4-hydroxy-6-hydroxymethyldihydropteridine diphosphokinase
LKFVVGVGASGALAEARVADGIARLDALPRDVVRVLSVSRAYANPAFGGVTHDRFVNAAAVVETPLGVAALLHSLHAIERAVGRVRGAKNGARALDLDVLWALDAAGPLTLAVGDVVAVPHPRVLERPSAVVPAVEALERAQLPVPARLRIACDGAVRATLAIV